MDGLKVPVNWSFYTLYDFTETVTYGGDVGKQVGGVKNIEKVEAAWGDGPNNSEWQGGFLMKLRDGRWAYAEGWCDYTGWGCQDGSEVKVFDHKPELSECYTTKWDKTPSTAKVEWDIEPADLNKWIADGYPESGVV